MAWSRLRWGPEPRDVTAWPRAHQPPRVGSLATVTIHRINAAFYAALVEEFVSASEEDLYAPFASPHGYPLAPEKQSAWRLQLPVLCAALEDQISSPQAAPAPWIRLEFDIPRLGRRVDAVLVPPASVIPIEFKAGARNCWGVTDNAGPFLPQSDRAIGPFIGDAP